MALPGVIEGVAGNIIYGGSSAWVRRLFGTRIRITSPKVGQFLEDDPQKLGEMTHFKVQGKLKRLPKGHEIWLLLQVETLPQVWPQGFFRVVFDSQTGEWHGRVNGSSRKNARIIAVVAPPTSHEFFTFFQKAGMAKGHFEPLDRIPPECKNMDSVQVKFR